VLVKFLYLSIITNNGWRGCTTSGVRITTTDAVIEVLVHYYFEELL
jgi:hypothetical protein